MSDRDLLRTLADLMNVSQEYIELEIPSAAVDLLRTMGKFPQFEDDIKILWREKIITLEDGFFKWNYSKTSLGDYFKSIENTSNNKFFWQAIENAFLIDEGSLRHVANDNGRDGRGRDKPSKDFEKISKLLQTHREYMSNLKKYNVITDLIIKANPESNDDLIKLFNNMKSLL